MSVGFLKRKSIIVAVLGVPNVGKSSLINYLLGTDLSVVCHKQQTTRNSYRCIFTIDDNEIILVDTPGVHQSNQELGKRLNQQALDGMKGADLNLILIDPTIKVMPQFLLLKKLCEPVNNKTWVVFTKSDKVKFSNSSPLKDIVEQAKKIIPSIDGTFFFVSAKTGDYHTPINGIHL